ncbi:MAG: sulfatase [Myxococcota bacterium]|nr:sulfatase [Myxococcota bacterium]
MMRSLTNTCLLALLVLASACQTSVPEAQPLPEPVEPVTVEPEAPTQPNLILISTDTLRADAASVYGGPAKTPHLEALARDGWLFERCISPTMLTNPAHASMFTALYLKDHGVYDNQSGIADNLPTLTQELKRAGYATAAVMGFPHMNPNVINLGKGFDEIQEATRNELNAQETIAAGLALLDKLPKDKPFFLFLHIVDPHSPYEDLGAVDPAVPLLGTPVPMARAKAAAPNFQKSNKWFKKVFSELDSTRPLLERYNQEVEAVDAGMGDLIAGLAKRQLSDTTAMIFTADHGENLGRHELYFHHGSLFAEDVHVPLIIHVPWKSSARVKGWTQTVDIAPTMLSLANVDIWQPHRGIDLIEVVEGKREARSAAFSEHLYAQLASIRTDDGTLIQHLKTTKQFPTYPIIKGNREFYQALDYPSEDRRLDASSPAAQMLEKELKAFLTDRLSSVPKPATGQDMDSLRALGYID